MSDNLRAEAIERIARSQWREDWRNAIARCGWTWETAEASVRDNYRDYAGRRVDALGDLLDAAETLTRVRAVLAHVRPICDRYSDDDPISCGWKRVVADIQHVINREETNADA